MIEKQKIYQSLIIAARCIAAPIALVGYVCIPMLSECIPMLSAKMAIIVLPIAYAVFVLLPIHRLSHSAFRLAVAIGASLAVASFISGSSVIGRLLQEHPACLIITYVILLPLYAYIPIMILNRRYEASPGRSHKN